MRRSKCLTVEEAVALLDDPNFRGEDVNINVLPPERVDELTDEDEGPDEDTGTAWVQDVPGSIEVEYNLPEADTTEEEIVTIMSTVSVAGCSNSSSAASESCEPPSKRTKKSASN